jgi:hypothetical protein
MCYCFHALGLDSVKLKVLSNAAYDSAQVFN